MTDPQNERSWLTRTFMGLACVLTLATGATAEEKYPPGLYAEIETSRGTIVLQLEYEKTPLTVANFVGLAEGTKDSNKPAGTPFYDGLLFHRVIPNFMVQGGDPKGTGSGGPGYRFADEFDPSLTHDGPGVLSMANAGPATNGSQFFITHKATPWLDGKHTVFGRVVEGQDVVDAITQGNRISRIVIVRVGEKAEAFESDQAAFDRLAGNVGSRTADQEAAAAAAVKATIAERFPDAIETASGLRYVVRRPGKSEVTPTEGAVVTVHYIGKLLDGTKFDSSVERGEPIKVPIGVGRVIPGWDEGIMSMTRGERRTLIIPPELGYGERGYQGLIPPNSTLVFEVELIGF